MCFGPACAPRVFTELNAVVAAHLHTLNIGFAVYLDDWLSLNQVRHQLLQDREKCLCLLTSLGILINLEKSNLNPAQTIIYLGALFNLHLGLIFPKEERHMKILQAMDSIVKGKSVARDYLVLLGLMASCIDLIPNARLFMRLVQLHLLSFWSPAKQSLQTEIPCTQHLISHFNWWRQRVNIFKGRSLQQHQTEVCITTDASKTMYGGHMGNQYVQGSCSEIQKHVRIGSSAAYSEAFHLSVSEQVCVDQIRQHNSCSNYQQSGWYQTKSSLYQSLGSLEFGNSAQYASESSPYLWQNQHFGRSTES